MKRAWNIMPVKMIPPSEFAAVYGVGWCLYDWRGSCIWSKSGHFPLTWRIYWKYHNYSAKRQHKVSWTYNINLVSYKNIYVLKRSWSTRLSFKPEFSGTNWLLMPCPLRRQYISNQSIEYIDKVVIVPCNVSFQLPVPSQCWWMI